MDPLPSGIVHLFLHVLNHRGNALVLMHYCNEQVVFADCWIYVQAVDTSAHSIYDILLITSDELLEPWLQALCTKEHRPL